MTDLHTHSNASDGDMTPSALMEKAAKLGLKAIALTDHDTIVGLEEAKKAAEGLNLRFIPGIELEIGTSQGFPGVGGEFHLLGLGINAFSGEFIDTLAYMAGSRERRNLAMIEKMKAVGIEADYEEIKALAGGFVVGRPHFASYFVKRRLVKNHEQAFRRWLGKGRSFYVPREGLEFDKAVRLIHEAGGAAILAHPMSLYVSWGRLPALLALLKEKGLDGIEAWHSASTVRACKRLEDLGRSLGFCITAGSDFHGSARPERKLGHTAGDKKIGGEFEEELQSLPIFA